MGIAINIENLGIDIKSLTSKKISNKLRVAHEQIRSLDCSKGTGWVELPNFVEKAEFININKCAKEVQGNSNVLLVIGIGGSYLGAKACISLLKSLDKPEIKFVGTTLDPFELNKTLEYCKDKDVSVNVISKSGDTLETTIAFEIVEKFMKKKYKKQKEYKNRIFVTTDYEKGELRKIATEEGYRSFVIPRNVGGRFSVFTPAGLFPMAVAGISIDKLIVGAKNGYQQCYKLDIKENPAYLYAASRYMLYKKGKKIECLCSFCERFKALSQWHKQLFAESEGKCRKGLFVSNLSYTTDLHSMGQYIQEGNPIIFETFIKIKEIDCDIKLDGIMENRNARYLEGKSVAEINNVIFDSVVVGHKESGVPIVILELDKIDEENVGELLYFFEMACGISAYMLGVNPFDQPGVEVYKKIAKNSLK